MRKEDFSDFCQMLDDAYSLLSRGHMPSSTAKAMFFRALTSFSIEAVRAGFDAHVKDPVRGKFAPMPADIVAQIEGLIADDGRPGAEEAWAMVSRAADESETVVWTEEMSQAFSVCQPIMDSGDQVGARMAFKESYIRQIEDARKARRPATWSVSLGHDASKRHAALTQAETRGLLSSGDALRLSPPQGDLNSMATLLLANASSSHDPDVIRARVAELKARLIRPIDTVDYAAMSRANLEEKKQAAAKAVEAYERARKEAEK